MAKDIPHEIIFRKILYIFCSNLIPHFLETFLVPNQLVTLCVFSIYGRYPSHADHKRMPMHFGKNVGKNTCLCIKRDKKRKKRKRVRYLCLAVILAVIFVRHNYSFKIKN